MLRFLSVFATGEMGVQHSQEISVLDFIRDGAGAGEEDLRWSALPLSAVSSTKGVECPSEWIQPASVRGTTPWLLLASGERGTPATASGSASGTTTSTPTLVRELFVGCKVKLAAGFEDVDDASSGPLSPGDVGTVLKIRTGEENSYQVKSKTGGCWWYRRRAIRLVLSLDP